MVKNNSELLEDECLDLWSSLYPRNSWKSRSIADESDVVLKKAHLLCRSFYALLQGETIISFIQLELQDGVKQFWLRFVCLSVSLCPTITRNIMFPQLQEHMRLSFDLKVSFYQI